MTCKLLTGALLAVLAGGAGRYVFPGGRWELAQATGVLITVILLPYAILQMFNARANGLALARRAYALILVLIALLLPALLLSSTTISPPPEYEEFAQCGALLDRDSYEPGDDDPGPFVRQGCDPARAARRQQVVVAVLGAVGAAGALAVASFRPAARLEQESIR